ncbi:hypothetical protein EBR66_05680 [bacterium]|nr:hypothetical protein [bacterium]
MGPKYWLTALRQGVIPFVELCVIAAMSIGVALYAIGSAQVLSGMDWTVTATFEELIHRLLLLLIGVEVIQVVRIHALRDVFLIALFVLARKALDPANSAFEVSLLLLVVVCSLYVWYQIHPPRSATEQPLI